MSARDYRDAASGLLLAAIGAFTAYYAASRYDMGTLRLVGPGMFPVGLGCLLVGLGVLVAVPAFRRLPGSYPMVEWRPLAAVIAGIAAFALVVRPLGMVPAIILLTMLSSLADGRLGPARALLLSLVLAGVAILVVRVMLGTPFAIARWPF